MNLIVYYFKESIEKKMSAFDDIIIQSTSGLIVDTYSDIVVDLLSTQINDNTVLTPEQKTSAIDELTIKAPKYQIQFTKMIELIVTASFANIKNQLTQRCYVVMKKNLTGQVNMSDFDILQDNGTYYHMVKPSAVSGYVTGRILFSKDNL